MKILSDFINGFDFVRMAPDDSVIKGGAPRGGTARALVERGKAMAIYVRKESSDRAVVGAVDRVHRGAVERRVHIPHVLERRHSSSSQRRRPDRGLDRSLEKEDSGRITLAAGQRYAVRLEYFYNGGEGVSKLSWTPPGGRKEAVPATVLRLPGGGSGLRGEYFKGVDLSAPWGAARRCPGELFLGREAAVFRRSSGPYGPADRSRRRRLAGRVARYENRKRVAESSRRRRRGPHDRGARLRHGHRASPEASVAICRYRRLVFAFFFVDLVFGFARLVTGFDATVPDSSYAS